MLRWALIFLVLAIIAAVFGFGIATGGWATVAIVLFGIFAVMFLAAIAMNYLRGRRI
ncbi:MAG: DUF1328 domain-containing protein [Dehalococcoidales bacterium]|nr:DUF1328 domain-containing protein [Dehalococcoidales bacterium]